MIADDAELQDGEQQDDEWGVQDEWWDVWEDANAGAAATCEQSRPHSVQRCRHDPDEKGAGPGKRRRTTTMVMWHPSERARMSRAIGVNPWERGDDPMCDVCQGETVDVTGD